MPPPDTILIPGLADSGLQKMDSAELVTYLLNKIDSISNKGFGRKLSDGPQYVLTEWQMFLLVAGIVFMLFLLTVVLPRLMEKRARAKIRKETEDDLALNKHLYDECLRKYNPYYASLPGELKERFLSRTISFMWQKEFRFHAMEEEGHIPLLISGAAVQMTFGLKNYLLDYFPVIHVIKKEYVLDMDKETYYGHVSHTGIYISWNHFVQGYKDYTDSVNVGLHEMAHAVSFDVFLGQCDHHDYAFRSRLEEFAEEGKPVFRAMRSGMSHLLDDYGATNFDEFWAVCVETFFENPVEFKAHMPDLYISVAELLNQDPLLSVKIIDPELAGFV